MYKNPNDPRLKEARLRHYQKNKKTYLENNAKRKKRNQNFLIQYLKNKQCVDCGETNIVCLHFDHKNRKLKKFNIGKAALEGASIESLEKEILKCEIRCANCHAKRTAKQFSWYKNGLLV